MKNLLSKNLFSLVLLAAVATSFSANAKDVLANITNVSPIYSQTVVSQQICDTVYNDQSQQVGAVNPGSVIGGIAGALLGSQGGGGNGRMALTALGAVTGAMSGDRIMQQQRNNQPQQICRWVQRPDQQISGYRVTYEYQQEVYQSVLPFDPSKGGTVATVPAQMSLSIR